MNGILSQAVANLVATENTLRSLGNLPPGAQSIQVSSSALIVGLVTQVQQLQSATAAFTRSALPVLQQIGSDIGAGRATVPGVESTLAPVSDSASQVQLIADSVASAFKSANGTVAGYFPQLATIEGVLNAQITALQGQLGDAQSNEDAAQKRYYYLLALGPFGLIGLAAALALYLHWKSQVDDIESQINGLNAGIAGFQQMKNSCQTLGANFQDLLSRTADVDNAVDFICGDLLTIGSDLRTSGNLAVINLMVTTASTQITTLAQDAA